MKQLPIHSTYDCQTQKEYEYTLNAILDIINEGVWDWNAKTRRVYRSPGWYRMLGFDVNCFEKDVLTWENIIHPEDYPRVMKHFELYTNGKIDSYSIEYRCRCADDTYIWIADRGKIVEYNEDGSVGRMIGAHQNIDLQKIAQNRLIRQNKLLQEGNLTLERLLAQTNKELHEKNIALEKKIKEIEYLSMTDTLTGVSNRRSFEEKLETEVSRAKRYSHPLSFALCDIDFFKKINDLYGHAKGDIILKSLAFIIKSSLRESDFVARWGGEEFALLFPDTPLAEAAEICERLREGIKSFVCEGDIRITCSFGVSEYDRDSNIDRLFIQTDDALYRAKKLGRDRVEVVDATA